MALSNQAHAGELSAVLKTERELINNQLRVALPGIIQSFDPSMMTCTAQPAICAIQTDIHGHSRSSAYPLLVDVPVVFPRGGGCTLTFPIKPGDECLLIFADRCIDFWWQNGGVQEPVDIRMHDLSDAFCIVGPQSQPQKISGMSASGAQLRTDDGTAFVEVAVNGDISATTTGSVTLNAPAITLNGNVTINGNLSQGMGVNGGDASLLGPLSVVNDITAAGVSVATHTHGGVETGGGNTGAPK